jgi:hypothetical protein
MQERAQPLGSPGGRARLRRLCPAAIPRGSHELFDGSGGLASFPVGAGWASS